MNSFEMIASYKRQARKAGKSREEIDKVCEDAMSGDREHLEEVLFVALADIEDNA